jgi:hypothetical protein
MLAKLVLTLVSSLAVLAAMVTTRVASADDGEFSLTAESTRRFGEPRGGKLDAKPLAKSMLNDTQSLLRLREPYSQGTMTSRFIPPPRISLENELVVKRKATHVEAQIDAGFPDGRTAAADARISVPEGRVISILPGDSVDAPSMPAVNHLALDKLRSGERKTRIVVEGVALRFWDEGATRHHYR